MSHHTTPEARIGQAAGILMAVTQDLATPQIIRTLVGPHVDALYAIAEVLDLLDVRLLTADEAKAVWAVLESTVSGGSDEYVNLGDAVTAREKLRQTMADPG